MTFGKRVAGAVVSTALSLGSLFSASGQTISLTVPAGVPLRLYLTKRVSKRTGAPVEGRLLSPVFAYDREVIPAGSRVLGQVSRVDPVTRWARFRAVMGGDFSPLHIAQIQFSSLVPPNGSPLEVRTFESPGLNSLFPLKPPKVRPARTVKQKASAAVDSQIDRIRSIPGMVRGPGKTDLLMDYGLSRLPWHPQYVRNRTRFDAELQSPLNFGSEELTPESLSLLGSQPAAGSIVHARLLTPLDSVTSTPGEKIQAVLEQPLFSPDHKLILPEGAVVDGAVVMARRAGWFHHPGQLRFNFQHVDLPSQSDQEVQFQTQATLTAAESPGPPVTLDKEGGVKATESKTRFIATLAALMVSRAAGDNDSERAAGGVIAATRQNIGGRTLGGGMGFGLLGTIAAQSSRNAGTALGYYGLGWAVFSTVIQRGAEVQFLKNAAIDIGFNQRALP